VRINAAVVKDIHRVKYLQPCRDFFTTKGRGEVNLKKANDFPGYDFLRLKKKIGH
jgi:hypothetical protein